jgi:hypothetical protein
MRLCTPLSLCLAAAVAGLPAATPAYAEPAPAGLPSCAAPGDGKFPLTTRIHDGPATYEAGGGYGTWYLDLTNTTDRTCTGIHPVVVLVDGKRVLKPSQPRLEFYDGRNGESPHSVRFEATDEDELVGAFADEPGEPGESDGAGESDEAGEAGETDRFDGFTVGPGKTLTVKVRLAVTSDAVPNQVTANAAVVQRHDGDGDWIGQSNDYRFAIHADVDADADSDSDSDSDVVPRPTPEASVSPGIGRNDSFPLPFADELARTGIGSPPAAVAATIALLLAGGALLLARRGR